MSEDCLLRLRGRGGGRYVVRDKRSTKDMDPIDCLLRTWCKSTGRGKDHMTFGPFLANTTEQVCNPYLQGGWYTQRQPKSACTSLRHSNLVSSTISISTPSTDRTGLEPVAYEYSVTCTCSYLGKIQDMMCNGQPNGY
jgi:hypothetical protein